MRPTCKRILIALTLMVPLVGGIAARADEAQRMALLKPDVSIDALAAAVESDDALLARTAARVLPSKGEAAIPALQKALASEDMMVRRCAAMSLDKLGNAGLELVGTALKDESEFVRQGAVFALMRMKPSTQSAALLEEATKDESPLVQRAAAMAGRDAFRTVESIPLPKTGWVFKTDVEDIGLEQEWFGADIDEAGGGLGGGGGESIEIEKFWGDEGPSPGTGWYRLTFDLPEHKPVARAQLNFQAVDESTWVWMNGEFVGEHDEGPTGWDKPFRLDVTDDLKWGAQNQITVRVYNTAMAGGIYKPVSIVVLEPAE